MADHGSESRSRPFRTARLLRISGRRLVRRLALSQLFLIAAVVVVAVAMLSLGNWIGGYLANGISRGVAATAASSIESLVTASVADVGAARPLAAADKARLDEVFRIGNDADSTRLLQIRIRDLSGGTIYESFGGIIATDSSSNFATALSGNVVSRVNNLPLQGIGPFPSLTLPVLEIHTPLRNPKTAEPFAVAELYYSAKSVLEAQNEAQVNIWALVGLTGLAMIGVLYILVARAGRTIASQRQNLARNLAASRRLSEENLALHAASEQLRIEAHLAHERVLAQLGADLHDGPIQVLTLIILRLTKNAEEPGLAPQVRDGLKRSAELAAEVMQELRDISSGLVLPELAELSLKEAVELAITRHEGVTGTGVKRRVNPVPGDVGIVVKICAYRVVQEALNNAFWHGDKTRPVVSLRGDGRTCLLSVTNSSHAEEETTSDDVARIGIRGMRFRVESLGGVLRVTNGPKHMTTIAAEIPLERVAARQLNSSAAPIVPVS
jgi:signal transduction histidine kinase